MNKKFSRIYKYNFGAGGWSLSRSKAVKSIWLETLWLNPMYFLHYHYYTIFYNLIKFIFTPVIGIKFFRKKSWRKIRQISNFLPFDENTRSLIFYSLMRILDFKNNNVFEYENLLLFFKHQSFYKTYLRSFLPRQPGS